jgi:hypothetical protein
MLGLQFLESVPEWALVRGLNDRTFNLLEQIVLSPQLEDKILKSLDSVEVCCIKQALEYARDKGLVENINQEQCVVPRSS